VSQIGLRLIWPSHHLLTSMVWIYLSIMSLSFFLCFVFSLRNSAFLGWIEQWHQFALGMFHVWHMDIEFWFTHKQCGFRVIMWVLHIWCPQIMEFLVCHACIAFPPTIGNGFFNLSCEYCILKNHKLWGFSFAMWVLHFHQP